MSSARSQCTEFRPHQLRPDKCKNCFRDQPSHCDDSRADKQSAGLDKEETKCSSATGSNLGAEESEPKLRETDESSATSSKEASAKNSKPIEESQNDAKGAGNKRSATSNTCDTCKKLVAERDAAIEELRALEREMEELHDSFKDEESEQFEQVKQELEVATKNCKILQIRLNKAERQYTRLEQVKAALERQLQDQQQVPTGNVTQVANVDASSKQQHQQDEAQLVKLPAADYDQLLRELSDTQERERDLQEQCRYSQEEAQTKSQRLEALEAENELLMSKVQKLLGGGDASRKSDDQIGTNEQQQENEQPLLGLELAQNETERLRKRVRELTSELETKEGECRDCNRKRAQLEQELATLRATVLTGSGQEADEERLQKLQLAERLAKLEVESRDLRNKLVASERERRQLKIQLEQTASISVSGSQLVGKTTQQGEAGELVRLRESNRKLLALTAELRAASSNFSSTGSGASELESDLVSKLKRELELTKTELASARARQVELEVESARQRAQLKQLVEAAERPDGDPQARRATLPVSQEARNSMSRQELREALSAIESELEEWRRLAKLRGALLESRPAGDGEGGAAGVAAGPEEQARSLRRQLDQQQLLSDNLKLDVARLEREIAELTGSGRLHERQRAAMEEELEKLRQLNSELLAEVEETRRAEASARGRGRELAAACERLRAQLASSATGSASKELANGPSEDKDKKEEDLLLARDLSELRVRNGFLIRQLESAREEAARQLDEQREALEAQRSRAVELAQVELKERHLSELGQLREELGELKGRLATSQRLVGRLEEQASGERDRWRQAERDWRREKSNWQQKLEQLESQAALERRAADFRLREALAQAREKERELIELQDKCVRLERDLKRATGRLEAQTEEAAANRKSLESQLTDSRRQASELRQQLAGSEEARHEESRRAREERATLGAALESSGRSLEEKQVELRNCRELLTLRLEQSFRERQASQARQDELMAELMKLSEQEAQARALNLQVSALERQAEVARRELAGMREQRARLKARCEELEARCAALERQELAAKTSNIMAAGASSAEPVQGRARHTTGAVQRSSLASVTSASDASHHKDECLGAERLSGKISDQRRLIELLKQQLGQAQLEAGQLRAWQASERNKWACQLAHLEARANEAEERLAFELRSAGLTGEAAELASRRREAAWAAERRSALQLIQQQQAQVDSLSKELKKLGQSHELLRLQARQLEAHNGKLSRRLIEFQQQPQQQQQAGSAVTGSSTSMRVKTTGSGASDNTTIRLEECERNRTRLEKLCEQLARESRPLAATLTRLLGTLETPAGSSAATDTEATAADGSSGLGSSRIASSSDCSELEGAVSVGGRPVGSSTQRPLLAGGGVAATGRTASEEPRVQSAKPAHQMVGERRLQSRIGRFLGGPRPWAASESESREPDPRPASPNVRVRRVTRTKTAGSLANQLGLGPSERRQLRRQLDALGAALEACERDSKLPARAPSSDTDERLFVATPSLPMARHSAALHVRWQATDSDAESDTSIAAGTLPRPKRPSDLYRRFPQASPGRPQSSASFDDYESDLSLASDFGASPAHLGSTARRQSGVESDGGTERLRASSVGVGRKSRGLRTRLTSTLRSLSRSIGGLASPSDSGAEHDGGPGGVVVEAGPAPRKLRVLKPAEVRV